MLPTVSLVGFFLAVLPMVITPGASFTLVSARGVVGDRFGAWAVIAGTALGICTHALFAGLGLSVIVMRSAHVYTAVRFAGAAYLVVLGGLLLWRSRAHRASTDEPQQEAGALTPPSRGVQVRRAYAANVLNVKAASVYLTLAPQFIPQQDVDVVAMLWLAGVHIIVMVAWLGLWSLGLVALSARVNVQRMKRRVDRAGGAVLVVLGVRSATQPG